MARGQDMPALTGIRGIAACFVVLYHYFQRSEALGPLRPLVAHGYVAVDLFFVLSGFVMALTYARTFQAGFSAADYAVFLGRRLGRVYPLYLVVTLAVIALIAGGWVGGSPPDGATVASNLLMVQAWGVSGSIAGPTWSISTEFAAYLLFPVLVAGALSRSRAASCACAVAAVAVLALVATRTTLELGQVYDGAPTRTGPLDAFGAGTPYPLLRCLAGFTLGLFAFRLASEPRVARLAGRPRSGDAAMLVVAALLVLPGTDVALVAAFVPLVATLAASGSWTAAALSSRTAVWLGEVSYSIYLVHRPVENMVRGPLAAALDARHAPHAYTIAGLVVLPLTLAVSAATYRWVERPARDWSRRLVRGARRPVAS